MDIGRLTQRLDDLIKSDTTLSLAIREYMGHMYPCHGDDAYAMYIAQAVYHAIDCLPDKRVSAQRYGRTPTDDVGVRLSLPR